MQATVEWIVFWQRHFAMPDLNRQILECEAANDYRRFHAIVEFFGYRIEKPKNRHKKRK